MIFTTAEKIETIVGCFLRGGTTEGAFGSLVEYEPGRYRVTADGKTVLVWTSRLGWHVSFKALQGINTELYVAASDALSRGECRSVSTVAEVM